MLVLNCMGFIPTLTEQAHSVVCLVTDALEYPLGMEDGGIMDSQITASSYRTNYPTWAGRLHGVGHLAGQINWFWWAADNGVDQWLQVRDTSLN